MSSVNTKQKMSDCLFKRAFLFLILLCFSTVLYLYFSSYGNQQKVYTHLTNLLNTMNTKSERFIRLYSSDSGGLGNQMFRLASLYGIGKVLHRKPALDSTNRDNKKLSIEFETLFPKLFDAVAFKTVGSNESIKRSSFGFDCCTYSNPQKIHDSNATWLLLNGHYYQSYKYFHEFRNEIRAIFEFGPKVMTAINKYASDIFGNDKSHKFCVHIRRDDFLQHRNLESRTYFVVPAVLRVFKFLQRESGVHNVSAVFIGAKPDFWDALNVTQNFSPHFDTVYNARLSSRGEDMAFGATYCDSFLISASGSTFGWWMAYLGNTAMPVFYNGQVSKTRNHSKDYHDYDVFPADWHKLEQNSTTGEVQFKKL